MTPELVQTALTCLTTALLGGLVWHAFLVRSDRLKHEFDEGRKHETELAGTLDQLYRMIHADLTLHGERVEKATAPLTEAQAKLDERLKVYEAALSNFVAEMRDVVKYSEERRLDAAQKKVNQVMPGVRPR